MPSATLQFLVDHGPTLAAGVTALLANGAVLLLLLHSPVHRQRVGELTILAALAWLLLACVPLPRLSFTASSVPVRVAPLTSSDTAAGNLEISADLIYQPRATPSDTTPLPAPPIAAPSVDLRPLFAATYLAGAAACCAWLVLGHALLRRAIRRSTPAPDRLARFLATRVRDGRHRPRLLMTDRIVRPVTCGLFRPTILLPARLADPALDAQVRQVLLHELAHVRHRDAWGATLFCLALPLLYCHPLYWWLRRRVHLARELVADDAAARADGRDVYAAHLVDFARAHLAARSGATAANTVAIFERPSDFYRRMHMLLERTAPLPTRCSTPSRLILAATWLTAVALAASLAGVRPAVAQDAPRPEPDGDTPRKAQVEDEREHLRAQLDELKVRQKQLEDRLARARERDAAGDRKADQESKRAEAYRREVQAMTERAEKEARAGAELAEKEAASRRDAGAGGSRASKPPTATPPAKPTLPPVEAPAPVRPAAPPDAASPAGARVGGVQLDLISLADRLVDASGAVKLAKARVQLTVAAKDVTSQEEATTAKVHLETAVARLELLRSIAQVALQSAKEEYALVEKQVAAGLAPVDRAAEARTKLQMLELILSRTN